MVIYFPLEHIESRYTTHLDRDILSYLKAENIPFVYMEPKVLSNQIKNGSFLDADNTIYRQFSQMNQLIEGLLNGTIPKDSTLFITDIWNFGIMAIPYLNFFGNYNLKVKGVLHAGSFTDTDFVRSMERYYKNFEDTIFDICDEIFVGSEFIKNDIIQKRIINPDKIVVTGLPMDFEVMNQVKESMRDFQFKKENIIVFNGRNVDEKQPYLFELMKQHFKNHPYKFVNTQQEKLSKTEYYQLLARAKVVVSFALQENFGYGIQEAVYLGCVPVVPNRLAYVEQFDSRFRYNTFEESISMVRTHMANEKLAPKCVNTENKNIFDKWFKQNK